MRISHVSISESEMRRCLADPDYSPQVETVYFREVDPDVDPIRSQSACDTDLPVGDQDSSPDQLAIVPVGPVGE